MSEQYATLRVWVEVYADFTYAEANNTSDEQFARIIAERITSGNVKASIVKCSTVVGVSA